MLSLCDAGFLKAVGRKREEEGRNLGSAIMSEDDTIKGWRIEHLFEQLDEDESGSLDEQELFTLMKVAAFSQNRNLVCASA